MEYNGASPVAAKSAGRENRARASSRCRRGHDHCNNISVTSLVSCAGYVEKRETVMTVAANFVGTEEQNKNYTVSSRKWVAKGTDVFVKEFTLGKDEEVPWHKHTNVFDIFYCIEGKLTIEHLGKNGGTNPDVITLNVGDSAKIDVGSPHRPFNAGPGVCRFLIIQGIGAYDFLPFKPD